MPFAATAVPKLIEALAGAQVDTAMLVDESGRRQPLLAAYRTDVLQRKVQGRDWVGGSVRALTEGLTVVEVAAVGDEALDCDTPEQLTAAQEAASSQPTG
jgi:molybdopterin-guanine dinucleotide biosynthesis protein A